MYGKWIILIVKKIELIIIVQIVILIKVIYYVTNKYNVNLFYSKYF